jgi:hypothetical protein
MLLEIFIEQMILEWQCQHDYKKGKPREKSKRKQKQRRLNQNQNGRPRPHDQRSEVLAVKLESVCRRSKR